MENTENPTQLDLNSINISKVPHFKLSGEYQCKIQHVYDGDTPTIVLKLPGIEQFFAFNVRLYGIDTPEVKGDLSVSGFVSRNKLIQLTTDQQIDINAKLTTQELNKIFENNKLLLKAFIHDQQDKYGRPLATLYNQNIGDISVNQILITQGFAKEYFGGKKTLLSVAEKCSKIN